ncbi:MAG: YggT family protein [Candidatus Altimarinota bacterium]
MIDLSFLILGIYYFLRALSWLIVVRIIIFWVAPGSSHPIALFIFQTTEHILGPIRQRLPRGEGAMAMFDWSPLVALILIDVLRYMLVRVFS